MLAKFVAGHQKDWDLYILYVLFAYRATPQESTGESPFYLMYGRTPFMPEDITMGAREDSNEWLKVRKLHQARKFARKNIEWAQAMQKAQYDAKRRAVVYSLSWCSPHM